MFRKGICTVNFQIVRQLRNSCSSTKSLLPTWIRFWSKWLLNSNPNWSILRTRILCQTDTIEQSLSSLVSLVHWDSLRNLTATFTEIPSVEPDIDIFWRLVTRPRELMALLIFSSPSWTQTSSSAHVVDMRAHANGGSVCLRGNWLVDV